MNVQGQAAVVTGAASGLGAATARALAAAGARVALLDQNRDGIAAVAAETGGLALPCDITDPDAAAAALAEARRLQGGARILVNCAGVAPARKIVGRDGAMPLDAFRRVIDINLIGSFNMIRLFAADAVALDRLDDGEQAAGEQAAGERAVIVNTASVAAFEGQIGQAAYAASKGAIVALTLPAAREFAGHGIRICAIAPGIFETPMMAGMPDTVRDGLAALVPFPRRLGRPQEYAALVLHIVGNAMLNGETIRLDGALRMAGG